MWILRPAPTPPRPAHIACPRQLATLLRRNNKPGFVVTDMTDLEHLTPITDVGIPNHPLCVVYDVDRGDAMRNWSPNEALPDIVRLGRTALTINEGAPGAPDAN
jgi:hypothetical protein